VKELVRVQGGEQTEGKESDRETEKRKNK